MGMCGMITGWRWRPGSGSVAVGGGLLAHELLEAVACGGGEDAIGEVEQGGDGEVANDDARKADDGRRDCHGAQAGCHQQACENGGQGDEKQSDPGALIGALAAALSPFGGR